MHKHIPFVVLFLCHAVTSAAEEWTQWRGPKRDGQASLAPAWPRDLSDRNLQKIWRKKFGPSYSGPIVGENLVFTTETRDKEEEVVTACDRETGRMVWSQKWDGSMRVPFFAASNGSWIRSTPTLANGKLFVAGMRDVLVCLDAATGKILWRVDFTEREKAPLPDFGFVCSPLVDGNKVYVQAGGGLCCLDVETGKTLWKALSDGGGMWGSAFSSPWLGEWNGAKKLLVQTRTKLAVVDPGSGQVESDAEIPAFRGMNILTPLVTRKGIFTSSYGGKSLMLKQTSSGLKPEWEEKTQGYMSSPVIVGEHIYLHLKNQRFTCIDLETGQSRWTTKPFGKYWSMIAQGDRILALDEEGKLLLIAANPEKFELLGEVQVSDDPTWAHVAIADGQIFIRELNALVRYDWK